MVQDTIRDWLEPLAVEIQAIDDPVESDEWALRVRHEDTSYVVIGLKEVPAVGILWSLGFVKDVQERFRELEDHQVSRFFRGLESAMPVTPIVLSSGCTEEGDVTGFSLSRIFYEETLTRQRFMDGVHEVTNLGLRLRNELGKLFAHAMAGGPRTDPEGSETPWDRMSVEVL